MADTCTCPDCQTELEINGLYGHNLECSECGCKLSVFHDDDIRVETPVGTIWISLPWEKWLRMEASDESK